MDLSLPLHSKVRNHMSMIVLWIIMIQSLHSVSFAAVSAQNTGGAPPKQRGDGTCTSVRKSDYKIGCLRL